MVSLAVDSLEHFLRPCFARPKLFEAHDALERGDLIAAGCLLREAARRFLESQCKYHNCLPPKNAKRSAKLLAKALKKAGHCDEGTHSWLIEIVDAGNLAAHCRPVKADVLSDCMSLLHCLMDTASGYSEFRRNGGAI